MTILFSRGLKFDNVKMLTEAVTEIIRNMNYCWVDSYGVVMQQNGVFRVNCVDCLDRTNVVQVSDFSIYCKQTIF